jgi:hypothetical protein
LSAGLLVWPAAWLSPRPAVPTPQRAPDGNLVAGLEDVLRRQAAWMRHVHQDLGGGLDRRSVTNVLTDTVIEWASAALPPATRLPGARAAPSIHPWDAHGIYREVHLPRMTPAGPSSWACDLAVMRSPAADLIIEIDAQHNNDASAKLAQVRDAGGTGIWIRWNAGAAKQVPGTHLIDLTKATRHLVRPMAGPALPRYEPETSTVQINEYAETETGQGGTHPSGSRSPAQTRYQAALWLAHGLLPEQRYPRLPDGLVVVGHRRVSDPTPPGPGGNPAGKAARYEVTYVRVPGSVIPVRPLVLRPEPEPATTQAASA